MGLTRHPTVMDLMIQAPGNGVVPRQHFGPVPQFLMGTSSEQGGQTFLAHREVMQLLQHANRIASGTEYSTIDCSEFTILTSTTEQSGMSPHWVRNVI